METKLKTKPKKPHLGRNVSRIRQFRGIKQYALAVDLGMTQQQLSDLEKQEEIPDDLLEQIADKLGVAVDTVKNFDEKAVIYNINHYNDIHDNTYQAGSASISYNEPSERITDLYERLLDLLELEKSKLKKN
ncbi:XRE family transcriptional regulator [Sinomicrobium pectinilyticum]|uniref:XRE family transcriptional regulator n=1 Tax=Sinomicrobium pectinilyticum TaxID=1084421 RepID=A0A3N0EL28_SINP1|nr:helix-turn-helix transcriptional regulator [Sinomicrobium pectinilyticum]RNL88511.1 XRE family transcriptional regulator [Sinomicrobium pectinilyticum]